MKLDVTKSIQDVVATQLPFDEMTLLRDIQAAESLDSGQLEIIDCSCSNVSSALSIASAADRLSIRVVVNPLRAETSLERPILMIAMPDTNKDRLWTTDVIEQANISLMTVVLDQLDRLIESPGSSTPTLITGRFWASSAEAFSSLTALSLNKVRNLSAAEHERTTWKRVKHVFTSGESEVKVDDYKNALLVGPANDIIIVHCLLDQRDFEISDGEVTGDDLVSDVRDRFLETALGDDRTTNRFCHYLADVDSSRVALIMHPVLVGDLKFTSLAVRALSAVDLDTINNFLLSNGARVLYNLIFLKGSISREVELENTIARSPLFKSLQYHSGGSNPTVMSQEEVSIERYTTPVRSTGMVLEQLLRPVLTKSRSASKYDGNGDSKRKSKKEDRVVSRDTARTDRSRSLGQRSATSNNPSRKLSISFKKK